MPILPGTPESVARAVALLRSGGAVVLPTETVYGLAALVWDTAAVARIFELKARPTFDPLIVHVADLAGLERVAAHVPKVAETLIARFWPGPLTLVLRKRRSVPGLVTAGLDTVAVRMPSHPTARAVLRGIGEPLAAPSANPFGALSPTRAAHVAQALGTKVDLILDGGPAQYGIESTIVAVEPEPALLRPGAVAVEEIEAAIGPLARQPRPGGAMAPGRLPVHYAPRTPLRVIDPARVPLAERAGAAALSFREPFEGYAATRVLSRRGELREAAAALFEALHALDALGLARIDAQPFPDRGLGLAIMDRLRRAAAAH
ncbi:MAG: threonylcarbamoyl-AMP synthase [Candidatus Eremiobacteraeota bacterium]|nr:threonylcarbamoyl-AMP synthase [Candidatus Eremiobacteraeota bacterium]MBV8498198.1 threonylcarbamoyl-AMP synthase [Candidatus Eremiobacteraeota bacterium]